MRCYTALDQPTGLSATYPHVGKGIGLNIAKSGQSGWIIKKPIPTVETAVLILTVVVSKGHLLKVRLR